MRLVVQVMSEQGECYSLQVGHEQKYRNKKVHDVEVESEKVKTCFSHKYFSVKYLFS